MSAVLFASGCVLAGCADRTLEPAPLPIQDSVELFEVPQFSPPPVDVLFVVDNSAAMAPFEARLAQHMPRFAQTLDAQRWWDLHVGVISADVGCAGGGGWRYAGLTNDAYVIHWRHLDNTTTTNYTDTLPARLTELAAVGHDGCGMHRPFDAIKAALTNGALGFRRDADLVLVIVGASDDASTTSVAELATLIETKRGYGRRVNLAAVYPEGAPRLDALVAAFQSGGAERAPIGRALWEVLRLWGGHGWWGSPCLEDAPIDADPSVAGTQMDCSVSDVVRGPTTGERIYERILPACTGDNQPCWRVLRDRQNCPWAENLLMRFDRRDFPPEGTITIGNCRVIPGSSGF